MSYLSQCEPHFSLYRLHLVSRSNSNNECFSCVQYSQTEDTLHHRLRGSASTVLTATGQVNGRWRILTPHRIETHEPIATKFRTIDYVRKRTPKPNLVQIHPLGASGYMGEI